MYCDQMPISQLSMLTAPLLISVTTTPAQAWKNPLKSRYTSAPLDICDQGSFFVGGVPKITNYAASSDGRPPQQITIGQSYVQSQIPVERKK